ncbi:hypothetical protein [Lentimonas sp. CC4]|uniref:hypothetical protein n=1 Tax=Lentimonas sp. CC4 TaxID=2676099 RepID=UPI001389BE15|nr:hypothetical protein [Lentimonas sp. CC4]
MERFIVQWSTLLAQVRYAVSNREFSCSDAPPVASVMERSIVQWSTLLAQVRYAVFNRESVVAMRR